MSLKTADAPVVVADYDSVTVQLSAEQELVLRRLACGRVTIAAGDTAGTWRITTSSHVGTIVIPGMRILIRPKVATTSLFYLLEASGRPADSRLADFDYHKAGDLIPSFATFYARYLERALRQGLPRAYREVTERRPGIRGRVDLPAQLRLAGAPVPVECRFDEYTADTPLNRILRGAAARLLCLPGVTTPARQALRRSAGLLAEAGPIRPGDLRSPVAFNRRGEHCRPTERLARIVLANETLLDAAGSSGAFLIDMNKAFEEFVAARLSSYLAGRLSVRAQRTRWLDLAGRVEDRPDLVFGHPAGAVLYVAGTKYKITTGGFGRDTDYYRVLAYASALNVPEGMLIYCQRDGAAPPREIEVGTRRTRLVTRAVGLGGTPTAVERRLRELATQIADRANPRRPR